MSQVAPLDPRPIRELLRYTIIGRDEIQTAFERDCHSPQLRQAIRDFHHGETDDDSGQFPAGDTTTVYRRYRIKSEFPARFNKALQAANRAGMLAFYIPKLERLKTAFNEYFDVMHNNYENLDIPEPDEHETQQDSTQAFIELNAAICDLMDTVPVHGVNVLDSAQPELAQRDAYELAVETAQAELDQAIQRHNEQVDVANAALRPLGVEGANFVFHRDGVNPHVSLPLPSIYFDELPEDAKNACAELKNANWNLEHCREKLKDAQAALDNRIVTLGDFVRCMEDAEALAQRLQDRGGQGWKPGEKFQFRVANHRHYARDKSYQASPYRSRLETSIRAVGKPWNVESLKEWTAIAADRRGETVDQVLNLDIGEAVVVLQGTPLLCRTTNIDAQAIIASIQHEFRNQIIPVELLNTVRSQVDAGREQEIQLLKSEIASRNRTTAGSELQLEKPSQGDFRGDVDAASDETGMARVVSFFTGGVSDEWMRQAKTIVDSKLTSNDKIVRLNMLIPFSATTTADEIGELLGVTKQAIQKTQWWKENRKGEKQRRVENRVLDHQERAAQAGHSNRDGRRVIRKQVLDIDDDK